MRHVPAGGTIAVVIAHEPVRVVLEIDRGRSTIRGRVVIDGAPASEFYGWLELIDEIDRASTPPPGERADGQQDRENGGGA